MTLISGEVMDRLAHGQITVHCCLLAIANGVGSPAQTER